MGNYGVEWVRIRTSGGGGGYWRENENKAYGSLECGEFID
jgi:hypothetical protein